MKPLQSDRLPSKARMLRVLAACLIGYAALELLGVFQLKEVSASNKLLCTRAGIVVSYLGALVVGLLFYWDARAEGIGTKAQQRKARAQGDNDLLLKLGAELQRNYQATLEQNTAEILEAEAELLGTTRYLGTKSWLGKVALVGVVVGAWLQMMGAT